MLSAAGSRYVRTNSMYHTRVETPLICLSPDMLAAARNFLCPMMTANCAATIRATVDLPLTARHNNPKVPNTTNLTSDSSSFPSSSITSLHRRISLLPNRQFRSLGPVQQKFNANEKFGVISTLPLEPALLFPGKESVSSSFCPRGPVATHAAALGIRKNLQSGSCFFFTSIRLYGSRCGDCVFLFRKGEGTTLECNMRRARIRLLAKVTGRVRAPFDSDYSGVRWCFRPFFSHR